MTPTPWYTGSQIAVTVPYSGRGRSRNSASSSEWTQNTFPKSGQYTPPSAYGPLNDMQQCCGYWRTSYSIACRTIDVSPSGTTWTSWKEPNGNSNSTQPGPKPEDTLKYWIETTLKNPAATPPCRSVSQTSYCSLMNEATGMAKLDTIKTLSPWCIIVYTEQYNKVKLKKANYQSTSRTTPWEGRSQLHRGGSPTPPRNLSIYILLCFAYVSPFFKSK